jgi:glycosyltransferase involved in cell wall biosynthesis
MLCRGAAKPLRILHIVGTISPAAGGPSEVIKMLIRYAPPGDTAELATLDDPAAGFLVGLPFPVYAFGSAKPRWWRPALLRWLRANRSRFDGVIVHGLWEYTGWAARRAFADKVPYTVFPHGMLDPWFQRAYPAKHLKKWLYWLLSEYWTLRSATRVLFTTQTERELAQRTFWPARWTPLVTPLGSEAPPADRDTLLAAFYARCPQLRGKRFLLFLGRIDPKKGCDLLVQAFAAEAADDTGLHLLMAGPDPAGWAQKLQATAKAAGVEERIHWPGLLLGEAKWGALAACEAFILPSHQENFGIAVVEALASDKPVLISGQVNIAPEIADAHCGLVEPDTLTGTRHLLERWLALDAAARTAMGKRAQREFLARYQMRDNTVAILNAFALQEAR